MVWSFDSGPLNVKKCVLDALFLFDEFIDGFFIIFCLFVSVHVSFVFITDEFAQCNVQVLDFDLF